MIFRQKSDSFYTFFKIIDAFPKVLDFSTMNFRIYSKKFGGIQKFCMSFSHKLHHIEQKIRLSCQNLRQIFESVWAFPQISDGYYEKKRTYSSYLWTVIACFFRQNSDNFYTLLKFLDNFPNFLEFVTIKFRWGSKKLWRFPQFSRTFFSNFSKANPKTNKQK